MDQLVATALGGVVVSTLVAIKPVINAYLRALERKANTMYQADKANPDATTEEERRQRVVKQLSRSMLGAPIPQGTLMGIVERSSEEKP
jgi:hypothetical protein